MKTLREHNKAIYERDEMLRNINLAGVACDMCETQMVYSQKTSPAGYGHRVHCPKCGYGGVLKDY